jgi:hypothetical protein
MVGTVVAETIEPAGLAREVRLAGMVGAVVAETSEPVGSLAARKWGAWGAISGPPI